MRVSIGEASSNRPMRELAIAVGGLILMLLVIGFFVYLTLSNPGLLDF